MESGEAVKCVICERAIKRSGGNTSNQLAHLKSSHPPEYYAVVEEAARRKSVAVDYSWVCLSCLSVAFLYL